MSDFWPSTGTCQVEVSAHHRLSARPFHRMIHSVVRASHLHQELNKYYSLQITRPNQNISQCKTTIFVRIAPRKTKRYIYYQVLAALHQQFQNWHVQVPRAYVRSGRNKTWEKVSIFWDPIKKYTQIMNGQGSILTGSPPVHDQIF